MKEPLGTGFAAAGAAIVTTLLGGWDKALEILLIVMALDYLTGVASAFKTKTVSSSEGYMGLVKKASIFLIVILAAQIDRVTGNATSLFRNCTAFFFVANDALSILENVGEMGIKLPGFLKNALVKLRDANDAPPEAGGDTEDENDTGDGN